MSENIVHVAENDFETEVLQADLPVLVDFWAEWCGPCKMIEPVVEQLATEYAGKIKVTKVNIDENPGTSRQFNVRGIPTLLMFKDGKVQGMKVGAVTKSQLQSFVDESI